MRVTCRNSGSFKQTALVIVLVIFFQTSDLVIKPNINIIFQSLINYLYYIELYSGFTLWEKCFKFL